MINSIVISNQSSNTNNPIIDEGPLELFVAIFSRVTPIELTHLTRVCRRFYWIIKEQFSHISALLITRQLFHQLFSSPMTKSYYADCRQEILLAEVNVYSQIVTNDDQRSEAGPSQANNAQESSLADSTHAEKDSLELVTSEQSEEARRIFEHITSGPEGLEAAISMAKYYFQQENYIEAKDAIDVLDDTNFFEALIELIPLLPSDLQILIQLITGKESSLQSAALKEFFKYRVLSGDSLDDLLIQADNPYYPFTLAAKGGLASGLMKLGQFKKADEIIDNLELDNCIQPTSYELLTGEEFRLAPVEVLERYQQDISFLMSIFYECNLLWKIAPHLQRISNFEILDEYHFFIRPSSLAKLTEIFSDHEALKEMEKFTDYYKNEIAQFLNQQTQLLNQRKRPLEQTEVEQAD